MSSDCTNTVCGPPCNRTTDRERPVRAGRGRPPHSGRAADRRERDHLGCHSQRWPRRPAREHFRHRRDRQHPHRPHRIAGGRACSHRSCRRVGDHGNIVVITIAVAQPPVRMASGAGTARRVGCTTSTAARPHSPQPRRPRRPPAREAPGVAAQTGAATSRPRRLSRKRAGPPPKRGSCPECWTSVVGQASVACCTGGST